MKQLNGKYIPCFKYPDLFRNQFFVIKTESYNSAR